MSATLGASPSLSSNSFAAAAARSTKSWVAGKFKTSATPRRLESGGLSSPESRNMRSPSTRMASRPVARICTPRKPFNIPAASVAAASMTCSQLSSRSSIRLSRRATIRPGNGFSDRISSFSTAANAVGTRRVSAIGARSISHTPCS
jgi:hypothetical protein